MQAAPIRQQKANGSSWTTCLLSLYKIHTDYEECLQHTPLLKSNTYRQQLWFKYADTDTNVTSQRRWDRVRNVFEILSCSSKDVILITV